MTRPMFAPIGEVIAASAEVTAVLGTAPVRFWEFADVPRGADGKAEAPYVAWQTVYGSPQNYVDGNSDAEKWGIQIDAYAATAQEARSIAGLLRQVLQRYALVVGFNGEYREAMTGLYRYSFTVEWITA